MWLSFQPRGGKEDSLLTYAVAFPLVVAIVAVPSSLGLNVVSDPESRSL